MQFCLTDPQKGTLSPQPLSQMAAGWPNQKLWWEWSLNHSRLFANTWFMPTRCQNNWVKSEIRFNSMKKQMQPVFYPKLYFDIIDSITGGFLSYFFLLTWFFF
jgi:hypothetical protein